MRGAPREPGGMGSTVGFLSVPVSSERQGRGRLWVPPSSHSWFPADRRSWGTGGEASDRSCFWVTDKKARSKLLKAVLGSEHFSLTWGRFSALETGTDSFCQGQVKAS